MEFEEVLDKVIALVEIYKDLNDEGREEFLRLGREMADNEYKREVAK